MAGVSYDAPYSYFIKLKIGSLELSNNNLKSGSRDPKYIQSLQLNKLGDITRDDQGNVISSNVGNLYESAVFKLSAVNDITLEKKILTYIANNPKEAKVQFQYGYVRGHCSPVYNGVITKMALSADFYTIELTVSWSGVASKYNQFTQDTLNKICKTKYQRYSDLVMDIASTQGWQVGGVSPTTLIDPSSIEYPTINITPLEYIRTKVVPNAVSAEYEGKFKSIFKDNEKYYFVPTAFLINHKIKKNYNFIIRMLPNGQVISFRPTLVDGVAAASHLVSNDNGANSNLYGTITRDTKELVKIKYSITDKASSGGLLNSTDSAIYASKAGIKQNSTYADALTYAESTIKDDFSDYCYSIEINSGATMEILGDPELNLLDLINVLPMYPAKSAGSGGVMHPSGGTYMITKITENIGSQYITSLQLVKMKDTLRLSDLAYGQPAPKLTPKPEAVPPSFKVGDRVWFKGATHYVSSYPGSKGYNNVKNMPGWAKITIINQKLLNTPGAHPYHLVYENWAETHVYGWVDYGTFEKR